MGLMDKLCSRVWSIVIIGKLKPVIDAIEVFVDWKGRVNCLVHSLIFGFEICGRDFPVSIDQILNDISARDSKEYGVLVIQLL